MWHVGGLSSLTRDQTCTPPALEGRVLTTGQPGKSWLLPFLSQVPNTPLYTVTQSTVLHGLMLLLTIFQKWECSLIKRRVCYAFFITLWRHANHFEKSPYRKHAFWATGTRDLHQPRSLASLFMGFIQTGTSIYFLMSSRMMVPEQ